MQFSRCLGRVGGQGKDNIGENPLMCIGIKLYFGLILLIQIFVIELGINLAHFWYN